MSDTLALTLLEDETRLLLHESRTIGREIESELTRAKQELQAADGDNLALHQDRISILLRRSAQIASRSLSLEVRLEELKAWGGGVNE